MCPCGAVVSIIDDGRSYEVAAECPTCVANGGQYNLSPAWHESDRDVIQLNKLGKYKPAALEEKWPSKKQREPEVKEEKTQGGQGGREQQTSRPSSQSKRQGRKQHR